MREYSLHVMVRAWLLLSLLPLALSAPVGQDPDPLLGISIGENDPVSGSVFSHGQQL